MKRIFDIAISLLAMLLLAPLSLLILLALRMEAAAPVLVRSHRVGRNGRMIKVWEFRTALADPEAVETIGGCEGERPTAVGLLLRRSGIARWPLLLNVLRGDFSLVGPRVELPRYVGCYPTEVRKRVLSVKPGLIDLASVSFDEEAGMLAGLEGEALEQAYVERVLPVRLDYAQRYLDSASVWLDIKILLLFLIRPLLKNRIRQETVS